MLEQKKIQPICLTVNQLTSYVIFFSILALYLKFLPVEVLSDQLTKLFLITCIVQNYQYTNIQYFFMFYNLLISKNINQELFAYRIISDQNV